MNSDLAKSSIPGMIFIIGRSRSGTTLLRSMLDMHSLISIPNECTFILQLAKKYKSVRNWNPEIIESFITDLKKTWLFHNLKLDLDNLKLDLLNEGNNIFYSNICKQVILNTSSASKKINLKYVGDKNPSYSLNLNTIYKIFGNNSKFIFLNRDYRDQYLSQKNAGIEVPNVVVAAKRWEKAFLDFIRIQKSNPCNFYSLRYEDLVTDTEKKLIEICSFLEIPFEVKMLEFYKPENLNKTFSELTLQSIHKSITNPVSDNKIGLWKNNLNKQQVKILDKICGKYYNLSGYKSCYEINILKFLFFTFHSYLIYYFILLFSSFVKWLPFNIYLKLSAGAFLGSIWNKFQSKK